MSLSSESFLSQTSSSSSGPREVSALSLSSISFRPHRSCCGSLRDARDKLPDGRLCLLGSVVLPLRAGVLSQSIPLAAAVVARLACSSDSDRLSGRCEEVPVSGTFLHMCTCSRNSECPSGLCNVTGTCSAPCGTTSLVALPSDALGLLEPALVKRLLHPTVFRQRVPLHPGPFFTES